MKEGSQERVVAIVMGMRRKGMPRMAGVKQGVIKGGPRVARKEVVMRRTHAMMKRVREAREARATKRRRTLNRREGREVREGREAQDNREDA